MTQVQDIIQQGYRELNLIGIGNDPTAAQETEGLTLINQIYRHTYGAAAGELVYNWPLGNYGRQAISDMYLTELQLTNPPPNVKLVATISEAMTVYLPVRPSDGARMAIIDPYSRLSTYNVTLNGNGSTIENAATVVLSTNLLDRTWLYRGDQGNWARLADVVAATESPFPVEYDPYFAILLALRMAPRAGVTLAEETLVAFSGLKKKFEARYTQNAPLLPDPSLDWTSQQSYQQFWPYPYGSQTAFEQGMAGNGWWGYPQW